MYENSKIFHHKTVSCSSEGSIYARKTRSIGFHNCYVYESHLISCYKLAASTICAIFSEFTLMLFSRQQSLELFFVIMNTNFRQIICSRGRVTFWSLKSQLCGIAKCRFCKAQLSAISEFFCVFFQDSLALSHGSGFWHSNFNKLSKYLEWSMFAYTISFPSFIRIWSIANYKCTFATHTHTAGIY